MTHQPCHTDVLEDTTWSFHRQDFRTSGHTASKFPAVFFAYIRTAFEKQGIYRDSFTRLRPAGTSDEHEPWSTRQSQQKSWSNHFVQKGIDLSRTTFYSPSGGHRQKAAKKSRNPGRSRRTTPWTNSAAVAARRRRLRLLRVLDPPVDTLSS
jgi:hypothetical protein